VPSGVETKNVAHKTSHDINGPIKIITVGTVYPRKRQMDLVQAVDRLAVKYPIECYVVGDYSQATDWLPRIHEDLKNPNLPIKWLGGIHDREEINKLLQEADIACFPSGDESHPLALLEAGLCTLPLVISNLPPYSHIGWLNNKNCLMHPTGDVTQLEAHIERLISDAGLRTRLGNNARTMVLNKYNKQKFYTSMTNTMAAYADKS
jgi:glycosyltransferase involved in cell wall biosynthesis